MSFGVGDDVAFQARCDELLEDFAGWLQRQQPLGADAGGARVALDWKWGYAGGDLATWTVEDLDEFLLEWCPRKLSMAPEEGRAGAGRRAGRATPGCSRGARSWSASTPARRWRPCSADRTTGSPCTG